MLPNLTPNHALFLDLDGTLLDFAPTPAAVVVPDGLARLLGELSTGLGGALAMISGRTIEDIDLVTGTRFPAGAEHGFVCRDGDGVIHQPIETTANRTAWRQALQAAAAAMPGVGIEEKRFTLVVHFRRAPERGPALRRLVDDLVAGVPEVEVLAANMAWEIRPVGADKGRALAWLMQAAPFAGRMPVFIGDDTTDEAAIAAADALGGVGLHVHRDFDGTTASVRRWLERAAAALGR